MSIPKLTIPVTVSKSFDSSKLVESAKKFFPKVTAQAPDSFEKAIDPKQAERLKAVLSKLTK